MNEVTFSVTQRTASVVDDMKCRISCSRVITYIRCTMKATWVFAMSVIRIKSRILYGWKKK